MCIAVWNLLQQHLSGQEIQELVDRQKTRFCRRTPRYVHEIRCVHLHFVLRCVAVAASPGKVFSAVHCVYQRSGSCSKQAVLRLALTADLNSL